MSPPLPFEDAYAKFRWNLMLERDLPDPSDEASDAASERTYRSLQMLCALPVRGKVEAFQKLDAVMAIYGETFACPQLADAIADLRVQVIGKAGRPFWPRVAASLRAWLRGAA